MAGVAAYHRLADDLAAGADPLVARATLFSVRVVQRGGSRPDFDFLPERTVEAVAETESAVGVERIIFNLSLGDPTSRLETPTAWSTAVDSLAFTGSRGRLLCVAAGNVPRPYRGSDYPTRNVVAGLTDPGHALNVLTIGAVTDRATLSSAEEQGGLRPIAGAGELSPMSSGRVSANSAVKPDLVYEGGNAATDDSDGATQRRSLSIVTTDRGFATGAPLSVTNATSAACAGVSGIAAEVWSANQSLRAETVRGLLVHSARWTPAMMAQFGDRSDRMRVFGFGLPSQQRVAFSTQQRATLIRESTIRTQPRKDRKGRPLRDLHLYRLPLPTAELEQLGEHLVDFSVTLSYFAEPNEASISQYMGAGLRWDVQRPLETEDQFRSRINRLESRDDEQDHAAQSDLPWVIGSQARRRGTIESDRCRVPAVELAGERLVGVWPTYGWWKGRKEREDALLPYSLMITIDAGDADVDLHALIEAQISVEV